MERVRSGELSLAVEVRGEGEAVLLLHGFPDSHRLWRHQVPALTAAGYRSIAPDLRGFGESDRPAAVAAYGLQHVVADCIAVLDHFAIERAHVVGHDWGAIAAWLLAGFMPERVHSLTALSVGHPASFFDAGLAQREKSWYMLYFLYEGLAEETIRANGWAFLRELTDHHPEAEQWIADLGRDGALTAALGWYRANADPRRPQPPWPRIGVPVLGIWSSGDRYLLEAQMRGSAAWVDAGLRYERIEGASHWLPLDAPGELNALLLDFLP